MTSVLLLQCSRQCMCVCVCVIFFLLCILESNFEYPVKLVHGQVFSEGIVEVYSFTQSQWGMICDYGWTSSEANVVCRMLGFEG